MKVSLSASVLLATLFTSATVGCKKKSPVVGLDDSGLVLADAPAPSGKEPKTLSDLTAAGWSITPTSLSDVERVFGSNNSDLATFKGKFRPGDTVVRLVAPSHYWANSGGWDGYAIVRSGTVVATLVHILS